MLAQLQERGVESVGHPRPQAGMTSSNRLNTEAQIQEAFADYRAGRFGE